MNFKQKISFFILTVLLSSSTQALTPPVKDESYDVSQLLGKYRAIGCRNYKTNASDHPGQEFQPIDPTLVVRPLISRAGDEVEVVVNVVAPATIGFGDINVGKRSTPPIRQGTQVSQSINETYTTVNGLYQSNKTVVDPELNSGTVSTVSVALSLANGQLDYNYETTFKINSDDSVKSSGYVCRYQKL